jgi:hypothetical protein
VVRSSESCYVNGRRTIQMLRQRPDCENPHGFSVWEEVYGIPRLLYWNACLQFMHTLYTRRGWRISITCLLDRRSFGASHPATFNGTRLISGHLPQCWWQALHPTYRHIPRTTATSLTRYEDPTLGREAHGSKIVEFGTSRTHCYNDQPTPSTVDIVLCDWQYCVCCCGRLDGCQHDTNSCFDDIGCRYCTCKASDRKY